MHSTEWRLAYTFEMQKYFFKYSSSSTQTAKEEYLYGADIFWEQFAQLNLIYLRKISYHDTRTIKS